MDPEYPSELSTGPGRQGGWTVPLEGRMRCKTMGHELGSFLDMHNGMLVAYCERCEDRAEMAWFRGGTVAVLARVMATEALNMEIPAPSVLEDLDHVAGMLAEDVAVLVAIQELVNRARSRVAGP